MNPPFRAAFAAPSSISRPPISAFGQVPCAAAVLRADQLLGRRELRRVTTLDIRIGVDTQLRTRVGLISVAPPTILAQMTAETNARPLGRASQGFGTDAQALRLSVLVEVPRAPVPPVARRRHDARPPCGAPQAAAVVNGPRSRASLAAPSFEVLAPKTRLVLGQIHACPCVGKAFPIKIRVTGP